MVYVGLDLSSKQIVAYAVNERKRCVYEGTGPASRAGLRAMVQAVGAGPKLVAFEAGSQMKWVADTLKKLTGVQVHVVHPNEVKWITESRGKTDRVDAKKLAELARAGLLPRAVHVVEGVTRELREVASARQQLQRKRVALLNTLRGYVRQEGHRLPAKFFGSPTWRTQLERLPLSAPLKLIIQTFRTSIEALTEAERHLTARLRAIRDPRCALVETIPALGPLSARVVVGALDEVRRFEDQKAVANYGALTPTIYQSGEVRQLGRINRDGRLEVRRVLLQCAHTLVRMKSHGAKPLQQFFARIARRRGKKIALVALARKLLTTAYGVLKSGQPYDPAKLLATA
ncbi:MAG: IS110 family transposase [Nitrospiraceae bacterium]|nr:MAG: IS110 family transposase [Nitrospiraceae bacterium]